MGTGWGTPRASDQQATTGDYRSFSDPYKKCIQCRQWVDGDRDQGRQMVLVPCGHSTTYEDVCPSWSPVNGCGCKEYSNRNPDNRISHDMRPPADDGKVY